MNNPKYIRIVNLKQPKIGGIVYTVLELAAGNENATHPIYHQVRHSRAVGSYTSEQAIAKIDELRERDGLTGAIRQGQAKQTGFTPEPE